MNKTLNIQKSLIIFGIPLLIILVMVFIAKSTFFLAAPNKLALAITLDLILTSPIIYFSLIRKTSIPKVTVVPLLILGIVICSFILPLENQHYLSLFKTWILPLIELFIFAFVIYNILKAVQLYKLNKKNQRFDFFTVLKSTCYNILPKITVLPVVTEIAVFYYGFIDWKKRQLKPNEFSYHKDSGTVGLLIAIFFLVAIETVAFHLLLSKWNTAAAWVLTGVSIYSGIQILGFLKSMHKRPILIEEGVLYLRYGIMTETTISFEDIESIECSTKDIELNKTTRKLSLLKGIEGHNLVIKLKKENILIGLYGIKKAYQILALHVDKNQEFKDKIIDVLVKEKPKMVPD